MHHPRREDAQDQSLCLRSLVGGGWRSSSIQYQFKYRQRGHIPYTGPVCPHPSLALQSDAQTAALPSPPHTCPYANPCRVTHRLQPSPPPHTPAE